jgi:virulence factor Mce-like protein
MRRVLATGAVVVVIVALAVVLIGSGGSGDPTYKIEFQNAFGLVNGAPFKVAGVPAGSIESIDLCAKEPKAHCTNSLDALVTVSVTTKGFGEFRTDAYCQSRPQSLIGEYFIDCQPGQTGKPLANGGTLPVARTFSTIPADLLLDIQRLPETERFTLIINELGAAVAARSTDLQTALQRAVPALSETDNLLDLLANDSHTLQSLTANSNAVVTALANNSKQVQDFIVQANNAATDTATQQGNLETTLKRLPGVLQQLKPAMAKLESASVANTPVVENLNAAASQLHTLFTNIAPCSSPHTGNQCGFANASLPALKSLGQASAVGQQAVQAAAPTVQILNKFAAPTKDGGAGTGELAQNLAIVLQSLDSVNRAVEPDPRSPNGQGFTGLEALLQYVFNQTNAINTYGPFGHMLAVDAFASPECSPYATPGTISAMLKQYGPSYRDCYSWLGPNQPGVNETDPSDPSACVPDPGGAPPGDQGPKTTAAACPAEALSTSPPDTSAKRSAKTSKSASSSTGPASGLTSTGTPSSGSGPASGLQSIVSQVAQALGTSTQTTTPTVPTTSQSNSSSTTGTTPSSTDAQQLLNYLLSP